MKRRGSASARRAVSLPIYSRAREKRERKKVTYHRELKFPFHLHLFGVGAQYPDDDTIERQTAGPNVAWTIGAERKTDPLHPDALRQANGVIAWQVVGFDNDNLEAAGHPGHSNHDLTFEIDQSMGADQLPSGLMYGFLRKSE